MNGKRVLFSIWDTRVKDYAKYAEANGLKPEKPDFMQGSTHPVVMVSWTDARNFCQWLTDKDRAARKIGPRDKYRLPKDHEWSCAVGLGRLENAYASPVSKSGVIETYSWGKRWPPPKNFGNFGPSLYVDRFDHTSPVGSFPPNRYGLYDTDGNVGQWCEDKFAPKLEATWKSQDQDRVSRGSTWYSRSACCMVLSHRGFGGPPAYVDILGFRCVLAVSGN